MSSNKENKYIISGEGFYVGITYTDNVRADIVLAKTILWSKLISNAKPLTNKQAENVIKTNNLIAFVWSPFKEDPIRNKWMVVRRSEYTDWNSDETHNVLEWMVKKVIMESNSDIKFLNGTNPTEYYSHEEAIAIAHERNQIIIEELILKNEKLIQNKLGNYK